MISRSCGMLMALACSSTAAMSLSLTTVRRQLCRREFYDYAIRSRTIVDIDEARRFTAVVERGADGVVAGQARRQRVVDDAEPHADAALAVDGDAGDAIDVRFAER